jgi:hypothetical protein
MTDTRDGAPTGDHVPWDVAQPIASCLYRNTCSWSNHVTTDVELPPGLP